MEGFDFLKVGGRERCYQLEYERGNFLGWFVIGCSAIRSYSLANFNRVSRVILCLVPRAAMRSSSASLRNSSALLNSSGILRQRGSAPKGRNRHPDVIGDDRT